MERIYKLPYHTLKTKGDAKSLVTNGYGSYFSHNSNSSYGGWFLLNASKWTFTKILESINPINENIKSLVTQFYGTRRIFESGSEDMIVPYNNSILYTSIGMQTNTTLTLDSRQAYDASTLGRNYEISLEKNHVIVKFTGNNKEYFLAIKGIDTPSIIDNWREVNYSDNEKRKTPSKYWVYDALSFSPTNHMVISFGKTLQSAKTRADIAFYHFDSILEERHLASLERLPEFENISDISTRCAATCSTDSLLSLLSVIQFNHDTMPAIFAGFPWFFQIWSRDELISLGGLIELSSHDVFSHASKGIVPLHLPKRNLDFVIKNIISRHVRGIQPNGKLENRYPKSMLGSIDSLGWLAKRITDFIKDLTAKKQIFTVISDEIIEEWFYSLYDGLQNAKLNYGINGLFANAKGETWMDTVVNDDGRIGYRIEIQALFLSLYDALLTLGEIMKSPYLSILKNERNSLKKLIREHFIKKDQSHYLIDGFYPQKCKFNLNMTGKEISYESLSNIIVDKTIRPNVFLAAYLASDLLSAKEWETVFDSSLNELYMPWGGLASISKKHGLFQPSYTGGNDKSYHRGDSWFFVNNIAAIVLNKINPEKYSKIIKEILKASSTDILENGIAGHHSEISSASFQDSVGAQMQAWSSGTFIELVSQLYQKDN